MEGIRFVDLQLMREMEREVVDSSYYVVVEVLACFEGQIKTEQSLLEPQNLEVKEIENVG